RRADELRLAGSFDDARRGKRLHHVAIVGAIFDVAVGPPDRFAGLLIEGDDVVEVKAIHVEDQQILEDDRRAAGATEMLARQIAALPEDLAAFGAEAGGAVAAEMDLDAAFFDRGRTRSVAVEGVAERVHLLVVPEVNIVNDL